MHRLLHIAADAAVLFAALGVPFLTSDYGRAKLSGTDAVSSASVTVAQPSGDYVVLLNLTKHTDKEALAMWYDFFAGEEIGLLFEDIDCAVARSDPNGKTMAESYRARLPENQMSLRLEDGTLLLSKAENGKFDVIVMSAEIADFYHAETLYDKQEIAVLYVKGAAE